MFGGYGIFESGLMFALVERDGTPCLRAGDSEQDKFLAAGSHKHDRMPYWAIPTDVVDDDDALVRWAGDALETARAAKRR